MDWPLLEALSDEHRGEVLRSTRRRVFARNEVVFHEGDPGDTLHLVTKGRFAVRVGTALGDLATLTVVGPGEVFGELALVSENHVRTATVIALEPGETLSLHRGAFEDLRRRRPAVDRFLVQALATQVVRLTEDLVDALYVPAEKRIARRLCMLHELYDGGQDAVTIPLTQEDIATMAGVTRPTVNRVLRALQDDGTITLRRGRLQIDDLPALQRQAA